MPQGAGLSEIGGENPDGGSSQGLPGGMDLVLGSAIALAAGLSSIYHQDQVVLRAVLSVPALLFVPGYFLLQAIVPSLSEPPSLGRQAALSIGFSLPLVGLASLAIVVTPWGFQHTPIALSVTFTSLSLAGVAGFRRVDWIDHGDEPDLGHHGPS